MSASFKALFRATKAKPRANLQQGDLLAGMAAE